MGDIVEPKTQDQGFLPWLDALEKIMTDWHAKHGNLPYELPLDRDLVSGNNLCWMDSFDDGMTPQEAFDSDLSYWEE